MLNEIFITFCKFSDIGWAPADGQDSCTIDEADAVRKANSLLGEFKEEELQIRKYDLSSEYDEIDIN